ncbi:MAG: tyrosine-type recombinase/integrase [Clostridia bacterium]|nr:tyrosine-type recombinase/integrase [Clostridia bacterium]
MQTDTMSQTHLQAFECFLIERELSCSTRQQYLRAVKRFLSDPELPDRVAVLARKNELLKSYAVTSANAILAAWNLFFRFLKRDDLRVRQFKVQKQLFCPAEEELSKDEYERLVRAAQRKNNQRLALLLETICATGIRVSELTAITVEAARTGVATVSCKGKTRCIVIVSKLRKKLLSYARLHHIEGGIIFRTQSGKPIDRSNIWREMKALCKEAQVSPKKVFPHNLRHLFARLFYAVDKDLSGLADVLGHSNINTTRIYIISSGREHRRRMEQLHLIL